jgi:hypothetical protein
MTVWTMLTQTADSWASLYSNSAVLRTAVGFTHIVGLVAGGGAAIVEDRAVLATTAQDDGLRRRRASDTHRAHRVVVIGLGLVIVSGVLLFAADYELFLSSRVFWAKMGLVGLLLANGAMLTQAGRAVERGQPKAWGRLRLAAMGSLALWLLITLLGAALPNV